MEVLLVYPGAAAGHHYVEHVILPLLGGRADPRLAVGFGHGTREWHDGVNYVVYDGFDDGVRGGGHVYEVHKETGGRRRWFEAPQRRRGAGERSPGNLGERIFVKN